MSAHPSEAIRRLLIAHINEHREQCRGYQCAEFTRLIELWYETVHKSPPPEGTVIDQRMVFDHPLTREQVEALVNPRP